MNAIRASAHHIDVVRTGSDRVDLDDLATSPSQTDQAIASASGQALAHFSQGSVAEESSLLDRTITVITTPFDAFSGIMWLIATVEKTVNLFIHHPDGSDLDTDEKIAAARVKAFKNGVAFVGHVGSVTTWLDSVKIVRINPLALSICQSAGSVISLVLSWIGLMHNAMIIDECNKVIANPLSSAKEQEAAGYKLTAAVIGLITQIASILWGVLTLISLCFAITFPPALLFVFLFVGIGGGVVEFLYTQYTNIIQKIDFTPPAKLSGNIPPALPTT